MDWCGSAGGLTPGGGCNAAAGALMSVCVAGGRRPVPLSRVRAQLRVGVGPPLPRGPAPRPLPLPVHVLRQGLPVDDQHAPPSEQAHGPARLRLHAVPQGVQLARRPDATRSLPRPGGGGAGGAGGSGGSNRLGIRHRGGHGG